MCDEYYDERTKAFWRAMLGDEELEEKDEKVDPLAAPMKFEPTKPKPKMLVR
jgi:hypothetical protein